MAPLDPLFCDQDLKWRCDVSLSTLLFSFREEAQSATDRKYDEIVKSGGEVLSGKISCLSRSVMYGVMRRTDDVAVSFTCSRFYASHRYTACGLPGIRCICSPQGPWSRT